MTASLRILLPALLVGALASPAAADRHTSVLRPNPPASYIVVKGDTLWDISGRFLREPWLWPEVWQANPQIANPHLIYPGDEVYLTYRDGRPIIRVRRGVARLSPRVRRTPLAEEPIPTIPVDAIQQFLSRPRVVTQAEYDASPYILSMGQEALIARPGEKIYVRGIADDAVQGRFSVYRLGDPYIDPVEVEKVSPRGTQTPRPLRVGRIGAREETGELLGYEAIHVGDAVLTRTGDPATLVVTGAKREILAGDRLVPTDEDAVYRSYMPRPPDGDLRAKIISVFDGVTQIGQYMTVVVNRGARDGIEPGHVMGVFQRGEVVEDPLAEDPVMVELDRRAQDRSDRTQKDTAFAFVQGIGNAVETTSDFVAREARRWEVATAERRPWAEVTLPEERIGTVMVYRTFERVSYALVMEATRAIHVYDSVKNP